MENANTKLVFRQPEQVKEFVRAAEKCDFDIDVVYNKVIVDAKSFLGVLSLISLPVFVKAYGENHEFMSVCQKFAA
jgi:hypothetical protein